MNRNKQLPADAQERIKADAETAVNSEDERIRPLSSSYDRRVSYLDGYEEGYIAGATAENARAEKLIKRLLEGLEQIVHAPVPANEREYMAWFVTAKNVAGGTISEYEAEIEIQQWKGKEVENG